MKTKEIKKKMVYAYCVLLLVVAISNAIYMIVNTDILRRMISAVLLSQKQDLFKCFLFLFIFMVVNVVVKFLSNVIQYELRKKETTNLEMDILDRYSMFKCWNINKEMSGYQAVFVNDVPAFINLRVKLFVDFSSSVLMTVLGVGYALSIDVVCTCVSIGLVFFLYFFLNSSMKKLSTLEKELGEKHNNCYSYTWNFFQNLEILSFLNISNTLKKFDENSKETVEFSKKKSKVFANVALGKNIINSGVLIVVALCVALGSIYIDAYTFSMPDILALFIVIPQVSTVISKALQFVSDYKVYKGIEDRINKTFDEPLYNDVKQEMKLIDSVEFKGVSFKYVTGNGCLNDVSFSVNKGENILLSGPSGCGKSTLVKLLLGLIDGYKGEILINGVENNNVNRKSIWDRCSYIGQECMILSSSIKNNVVINEVYDEVRFWNIIEKVGLKEVVSLMPKREQTELTDSNVLSSGERQKLCLARALYKQDLDLLILDEATAALDPSAETEIIQSILDYVMENRKILIWISHNEKMELLAGKVYRIDQPV